MMVLVLTAGVLSAAAVETRRAPTDGTVRAAGGRPVDVDADVTTTTRRTGRPSESTSTTSASTTRAPVSAVPSTTATSGPPGSTSTSVRVTTTAPPVVVEIPFSSGRTSWTGVTSGVTITVKVDKANPDAGEPVRFDVEASSASRACCAIVLRFGDGSMYPQQNQNGPCVPGAPQGHGPVSLSTVHTYSGNNQWMFEARALTGNCDEPGGAGALFGILQVGPSSTGQGPARPDIWMARSGFIGENGQPAHQGDRSWAAVVAIAKDDDGWVRSAKLDWGDGTKPQVFASGMICRPTVTGWPGGTQIAFGAVGSGEGVHHYANPGTYTVTVTAVSTGCDGTVTQTGTGTLVWDTA